jgi:hypothetical protein
MLKFSFLILSKILLGGWSIVLFYLHFIGFAFATQNIRNLLKPEVWTSFGYGFGCIFAAYCFFSTLGILKSKALLFSGILMHFLAVTSLFWGDKYNNSEGLQFNAYLLGIYTLLWWLHFALTYRYYLPSGATTLQDIK